MRIILREFEESDREALRHLYLESRKKAFTWSPIDHHQLADFDAHIEGERILVAVVEGEVLGFASIWEPESFLHNLFVHPSATRQGIGQALLGSCAKYFNKPSTHCSSIKLKVGRFCERKQALMVHTSLWRRHEVCRRHRHHPASALQPNWSFNRLLCAHWIHNSCAFARLLA